MLKVYIPSELLNISNITRWKKRSSELIDYYYKHFSYFHQERSKILGKLKAALIKGSSTFSFNSWHRLVPYQYSNNPLSAKGSLLNDPGGRFNIGDINTYKFQSFPALYIAQDFEAAYRERFQLKQGKEKNGLSPEELLLCGENSFTTVVLTGKIHRVLDLREQKTLRYFYQEIKNIKLPDNLKKEAKSLKISVTQEVHTLAELRNSILDENWRDSPMQVDIPSNSQILGQIAEAAGIEGVLYSSTKTSGKRCLAIFPRNFNKSLSYVKIKGNAPSDCKIIRLDKNSCMKLSQ